MHVLVEPVNHDGTISSFQKSNLTVPGRWYAFVYNLLCCVQTAVVDTGRPRCQEREEDVLTALRTVMDLADAPALACLRQQRPTLFDVLLDAAARLAAASWAALSCLGFLLRVCGAEVGWHASFRNAVNSILRTMSL